MTKLIVSLLSLTCALAAAAQSFVGSWELFPNYSTPNRIIETPEYVYTLSGATRDSNNGKAIGGSLSFYDKTTGEIGALNSTNRLNANKVYNIWYSREDKCLFVAYEDFNIDLVYDDGRTISVPDLRDAAISDNKFINDVAFAHGKAYLGMMGGMVVIDMEHGAVTESALWGKNINVIAASEKKLFLGTRDRQMYIGNLEGSHHNFSTAFAPMRSNENIYASNLIYLGNSKIYATDAGRGYIYTVLEDKPNNDIPYYRAIIEGHPALNEIFSSVTPTRNGALTITGNTANYVSSDGTYTPVSLSVIAGNQVADWAGDAKSIWLANAEGFGEYSPELNAFTISRSKPKGTSGSNVGRIIQHPRTGNFYISTAEVNQNPTFVNLAYGKPTAADIYSGKNSFTTIPGNLLQNSLANFAINPNNPNQIFIGRFFTTSYIVNIDSNTAMPIDLTTIGDKIKGAINGWYVDKAGNLLMLAYFNNKLDLFKAPKGTWETEIKSGEWSHYVMISSLNPNHSTRMVVDEDHGIIVVTGHNGIGAISLPDVDKPLNSSVKSVYLNNATDSDGSTIGGYKYPAIALDKNGWVWIGNDVGVMYIKDSREMFNPGFAVSRPKVARNDGTNLADYLLNQVEVSCIAVDENNHKWIGTLGSGLYRVNEDGTEILEHLTTDNSDIPSNDILAVCPDRNSNDVYIGTADGLSVYHSTTAPAAESYDDVYAYPNPVTPDYTGYITITGLKANSLVKIADAAGNVFFETRSNGGMALWNGLDKSGRRIRSGVYFVFASETGELSSDAAVTKIVVVN